jgi:hypothetical protein
MHWFSLSPCPDPGRADRPSHCEIREFVVPVVGNALAVDASPNGGVKVELAGDGWQGAGLDVQTVNGGVSLLVPDGYSAHVAAGTRNGGVKCEFPITAQGALNRELATDLGQGGAPITIRTKNGGVTIGKR